MNLVVSVDNSFLCWSLFGYWQVWCWVEEVIVCFGVCVIGFGQMLCCFFGGNQQKVVIGKWLCGDVNVLIFDELIKGVDVKVKIDLFMLIDGLVWEGKGVIYVLGEFVELVGLCDCICVLWDGWIVVEIFGVEVWEEILFYYLIGGVVV